MNILYHYLVLPDHSLPSSKSEFISFSLVLNGFGRKHYVLGAETENYPKERRNCPKSLPEPPPQTGHCKSTRQFDTCTRAGWHINLPTPCGPISTKTDENQHDCFNLCQGKLPVLPHGEQLHYLGITLNSSCDPVKELSSHLQKAHRICTVRRTLSNHSELTYQWCFSVHRTDILLCHGSLHDGFSMAHPPTC